MKGTIMPFFLVVLLAFSLPIFAKSGPDKKEVINGVSLVSAKEKNLRSFTGSTQKTLHFPIELVKKGVTNFTEKCNNSFKSKRKYSSEKKDCKYHNENLVETFVVKDIRKMESFKNFKEVYLLGRHVYNRGTYGYYELATVQETKNDKNQRTIKVLLRMLDDNEVKLFTELKITKDTAFDTSTSSYVLTEISPEETLVEYEYNAETDHWLLNKEVSVPQVFASISRSVNDLLRTIETESSHQKREIASKE